MNRYYYNNWLAKALLCMSSCHTIAIGPFVLSKRRKEETSQVSRNHETCHAMQWLEVTFVSGFILILIVFFTDSSIWWMALSPVVYYAAYILEWMVKLPICMIKDKNAYRAISFEQEAYGHQEDGNYIENRPLFAGWVKHVFKLYQ